MLSPSVGMFFLSTVDFSISLPSLRLRLCFLSLSPLVFTSSSCSYRSCSIFALPSSLISFSSFSSFSHFVLPLLLILLLLIRDLFYFGGEMAQHKLFESNRWLLWSKVMIWGGVPAAAPQSCSDGFLSESAGTGCPRELCFWPCLFFISLSRRVSVLIFWETWSQRWQSTGRLWVPAQLREGSCSGFLAVWAVKRQQ